MPLWGGIIFSVTSGYNIPEMISDGYWFFKQKTRQVQEIRK